MWVMRSSFKLGNGISMENIDQSRLCQVDGIFVFAFEQIVMVCFPIILITALGSICDVCKSN